MKTILPALLAAALAVPGLAAPVAAQAPSPALPLARIAAVADSLAPARMEAFGIPGMTVAVARNGEIVFQRAYGTAVVESGTAATTETVYGIASITKQITAALVMRLVDAGRISLDDPITNHLPDYPVQGRTVTIRHLLNHTSGIAPMRATSAVSDSAWYEQDRTYAQMIDLFGRQPFEFEPGARHGYNNFAYYLLGEIIGRVTGTPYAEHVRRELAGMGLARTGVCDEATPGRARSYRRRDGQMTPAPRMSLVILGGAGALCSTAGDLVRWTHLLYGGQVVTPASLRAMTEPTTLATGATEDYGFGLYVEALGGHRKLFHGGGIPWGGYLSHYPEDGLTLVVLTNGAGARDEAARIEEALARAALGMEVPDLPLTADQMARYAGTYTLQAGPRTLEVRVWVEDGQLRVQPAGQSVTRLMSQGGHAFVLEADVDIRLVFAVEGSQATGVTLHQRGRAFPGTRNP